MEIPMCLQNQFSGYDILILNKDYKTIVDFKQVINDLGEKSSKVLNTIKKQSQNILNPMTTYDQFINSDQKIYFLREKNKMIGFLKIGKKLLYIWVSILKFIYQNNKGVVHNENPLCLLDFYISEDHQRKGHGRKLFEYMLLVMISNNIIRITI